MEQRPDPYEILRKTNESERRPVGKLKIFFGYAAGVGKTYAMLESAHRVQEAGVDVVAGYIEPHTRPETMALLGGLEQLPTKGIPYKGITLKEFDLDGALARHPQLILVDELAHTNAEGCRHLKRYQDVEELLRAGISVYTTVNVQHLESLNDVVASITGVTVAERVPDRVFDLASQVEVVDIEPADLLERLKQGKIYRPQQASQAMGHFFTEKNLAALREIALRRTADRLGKTPADADESRAKSGEHILICLSSAPSNGRVIRTAARMAEAFHGNFTALFVETPDFSHMSEADRNRLRTNLRLAEQLGARVATVYGDDPAVQIAEYVRVSGVTKIVMGRSIQKKQLLFRPKTLVDRLNELAPDLDIYIIPDKQATPRAPIKHSVANVHISALDLAKMVGILAVCTVAGYIFTGLGFNTANIIMVYILGVLCISMFTSGRVYSLLASVLSVLVFNFFFTYPFFTLMSDPSYIATFGIMFLVAFFSSTLTTRIKRQALQSAQKAYRTEILLETSQCLQKAGEAAAIRSVTAAQLKKLLERDILFYPVEEEDGTLGPAELFNAKNGQDASACLVPAERAVAEWVLKNNKHAGATTGTLPAAKCLYIAVRGTADKVMAVAGIAIDSQNVPEAYELNLMNAILDECGLALEKEAMSRAKRKVEETARQETLRANLLRAISHDLRTPLTSISGNAGILMESSETLAVEKRQEIYSSIYDDSMWLIDLVENLLSITRIENGSMKIHCEPELIDDILCEALGHLDRNASGHTITTHLADDFLMANVDARLVVQVIINIVNNAIKYTPAGSHIDVSAKRAGTHIEVSISDDGPGISDEGKSKLFEMFYTAGSNPRSDGRRGLGLGLSLCRSIVNAHGGTISVEDNTPHGTIFHFTLPASEVVSHE